MRDLVVSLLIFGLLPACWRRPFVGLVVFTWLAYMRVQDLTWGFAKNMRWSYMVALLTFGGYLVHGGRVWFAPDLRNYMIIALMVLVTISLAVSVRPDQHEIGKLFEFLKICVIALFTTAVVRTRAHLRVLVWVVALSFAFYGVKSGIWGILTLGRTVITRGPGGMMFDNNDFSLALAMAVPILWHVGMSEKKEIIRRTFMLCVPLTIVTIGLTHSRGGFLSIAAALGVLIWRSRNRVAGISIGLLIVLGALIVAPSSWKERIASIKDYEQDSSAQARFRTWAVGVRMAWYNPIWGVGLYKYRQHYLEYQPNPNAKELSDRKNIFIAHNSYVQIWCECGTPAFLIYLSLFGWSFLGIWKIRRLAKRRYHASWMINYATMFEASLVAFGVGAVFLNRGHFDLFYQIVAMIVCFERIAKEELRNPIAYPARQGRVGPAGGDLVPVRRPGFGPRPRPSGFGGAPVWGGGT